MNIRESEPFGIQLGDLRLLVKRHNRYGARLQVRDKYPEAFIVGHDIHHRVTRIQATPIAASAILERTWKK